LVDLGARLGSGHYSPAVLGLGLVSLRRGDTQHARAMYCKLLSDHRESSPDSAMLGDTLVYLASVEAADGLRERAQRLLGANEAWHAARGPASRRWFPNLRDPLRRGLVPVPSVPVDRLLIQAREEGRAMSLDAAVAYAVDSVEELARQPAIAAELEATRAVAIVPRSTEAAAQTSEGVVMDSAPAMRRRSVLQREADGGG